MAAMPTLTRPMPASARIRAQVRGKIYLLPLLGLIPCFLLASYSLTEPWARARVLGFLGISRSPGAVLLVIVSLAGMIGASFAVATSSRRREIAAAVHIATGILMAAVAWGAFSMIQHSGVRLLGVAPLASVRPGRGLRHFVLAAALVVVLGMIELFLAARRRRSAALSMLENEGRRDG